MSSRPVDFDISKLRIYFLTNAIFIPGILKVFPSTRSTLNLSRLNTFIFHFSALKSCFNILNSDVMGNTPFHL